MKWDELSDKDKLKLILEHVIPHGMDDSIVFKDLHIMIESHEKPIQWPVAAWDDFPPGTWWIRDFGDDNDTAFDPLHDMNDAWKIAERFDEIIISKHLPGKYHCELWRSTRSQKSVAKTPQEAICKTALQALGVEIER